MELGTVLVVIGVLAAALAAVLNSPPTREAPTWLLPLAVILVGLGVLLGTGEPWIKT